MDENGEIIVDIDIISAISEGNPKYVALPPNKDNVTELFLPGYTQNNSTAGREFTILHIPATATQKAKIVVYYEEDSDMFSDSWIRGVESRRLSRFCSSSIITPIALLTMPPPKMISEVLSLLENERRLSCSEFLVSNKIQGLGLNLVELTNSIEIWEMADSQ